MRELKLRNAYIRAKFESQTPKQLTTAIQPLIPTLETSTAPSLISTTTSSGRGI